MIKYSRGNCIPWNVTVALFPRWTAPTAKAASTTATHATRLDRRGLFLMWKVRSYSDVLRICDDTTAGDNGPPAGGKRRLIREGRSTSRVSIHARPRTRDPGGGTVSTVPPRRTILDDVSLAAEQSGGEPPLVSPGCSALRAEKALAECPHDVVGLHAHKGTMWMSNDGVPLKNVESPYGGGVSPLLGAAGVCTPAMFPVAPALLADEPPLGPWQVAVVRVDETPAGDSPCATQNRHRPMDIYELPDSLAHTVVEGGPVGPEVTEPLGLLVLDHADPVGQHAAIQNATSTLEHLPAQPEPSLGGGLGDRISDGEPAARQVPDTTLDSQLMEGITHLEHLALRVSLDSGPMEGTSCLEPLEQSILQSPWTIDLWRGLLTWSAQLWGCPWTVDLRRGSRVWNHWSSRFLVRR